MLVPGEISVIENQEQDPGVLCICRTQSTSTVAAFYHWPILKYQFFISEAMQNIPGQKPLHISHHLVISYLVYHLVIHTWYSSSEMTYFLSSIHLSSLPAFPSNSKLGLSHGLWLELAVGSCVPYSLLPRDCDFFLQFSRNQTAAILIWNGNRLFEKL